MAGEDKEKLRKALREIKNLAIDGSISIELEYPPEPDRVVEWVREAYEATDRLMQQIGLRDRRA